MRPLPRRESRLYLLEDGPRDDRLVRSLDDPTREHEVPTIGRVPEHVPDPRATRTVGPLLKAVVPSNRPVLILEHPVYRCWLAGAPPEGRRYFLSPESLQESLEHETDFLRLRFVHEPVTGAPPLPFRGGLRPPVPVRNFLTEFDL